MSLRNFSLNWRRFGKLECREKFLGPWTWALGWLVNSKKKPNEKISFDFGWPWLFNAALINSFFFPWLLIPSSLTFQLLIILFFLSFQLNPWSSFLLFSILFFVSVCCISFLLGSSPWRALWISVQRQWTGQELGLIGEHGGGAAEMRGREQGFSGQHGEDWRPATGKVIKVTLWWMSELKM